MNLSSHLSSFNPENRESKSFFLVVFLFAKQNQLFHLFPDYYTATRYATTTRTTQQTGLQVPRHYRVYQQQALDRCLFTMATATSLMISLLEEQAALLQRHIAILKASEVPVETTIDSNGKKKNVKRVIDPNKPKRAPSAYLLYMTDTQGPFKISNPTMTQTEVVGILGKRWKTIAPETAERYHKAAEALKISQDSKIAAYETNHALPSSPTARKKKNVSSLKALVDLHTASISSSSAMISSPVAASEQPAASEIAQPKTPIAAPKAQISTPVVMAAPQIPSTAPKTESRVESTPTGTGSSEVKEHKKKKKRKHGDTEVSADVAPVPTAVSAVIEALPATFPESEKKKVSTLHIPFYSVLRCIISILNCTITFSYNFTHSLNRRSTRNRRPQKIIEGKVIFLSRYEPSDLRETRRTISD